MTADQDQFQAHLAAIQSKATETEDKLNQRIKGTTAAGHIKLGDTSTFVYMDTQFSRIRTILLFLLFNLGLL